MPSLNVWTLLWQSADSKPFVYSTLPKKQPLPEIPEARFYTPRDVQRIEAMLRRHVPEFNFYCLTNVDVPGVECIPLRTNLKGWWPQVEIWRPDLPTEGRNFYLDLDVLLIRDIHEIINFPADFAIIKAGPHMGGGKRPWEDKHGKWRYPGYQGSMKVWSHGAVHRFWEAFDPERDTEHFASDQDFLFRRFPKERTLPDRWFTSIYDCPDYPKPPVKAVLTYGMNNDRAAEENEWVRQVWEA